jgi:hypothetical protein
MGERPKPIVFELVNPLRALKEIAAANRNDGADFRKHREFLDARIRGHRVPPHIKIADEAQLRFRRKIFAVDFGVTAGLIRSRWCLAMLA